MLKFKDNGVIEILLFCKHSKSVLVKNLWSLIIRPIVKELKSSLKKISSAIFWDAKEVNALLILSTLDEIAYGKFTL